VAHWIWLPSQRTLPNTFVLFRREFTLHYVPDTVSGWITAESRYRLTVNGKRVQWGPAPTDPRHTELDPFDIAPYLQPGANVIGVEVLYYGHGDGTWIPTKPGFLCHLQLEPGSSPEPDLSTDDRWLVMLDRAHKPGQYKRWFLRALQEDFDARLHPHGWDTPAFDLDARWIPALILQGSADKPALCTSYPDYLHDSYAPDIPEADVTRRQIPLMRESLIEINNTAITGSIHWMRNPLDWFEYRTPNAFDVIRYDALIELLPITVSVQPDHAAILTFALEEQVVGWASFTVDAPEGTIIELIVHEAHDPALAAMLDSQFYTWTRFTCRDGLNTFEPFDFESFRWIQLHIRNASRLVTVQRVAVRRRVYDFALHARIACHGLQRVFDACVNTLHNCAQETIVDGMARERQQYSGDCGHQLHAIRLGFGETRLPERFLRTFSHGQTTEGYFFDSYPGYDRLERLGQAQVKANEWGPLIDHSVQFVFDCWHHYEYTGSTPVLETVYPHLTQFADYLARVQQPDGLLPVDGLRPAKVWIDHLAYKQQRHKQCAFNLYTAAMLRHALAPLSALFKDDRTVEYLSLADSILNAAIRTFWSDEQQAFVVNLPWLEEEAEPRFCDRSLATAILYDQCPNGSTAKAVQLLRDTPPNVGLSYPINQVWRYWALARTGNMQTIIDEFRHTWTALPSVILNNTISEFAKPRPDTIDQWSHAGVVPLILLYTDVVGIKPITPGFERFEIRPQFGDLASLDVECHIPQGRIRFTLQSDERGKVLNITVPHDADLVLPEYGNRRVRLLSQAVNNIPLSLDNRTE
jgi:alpha-L-rhamnosidase